MDIHSVDKPILFFDGVCNLCNNTVQFIIRHDKKQQFLFAPLQSSAGAQALQAVPAASLKTGSVILFYRGTFYTRSASVLKVCSLLGGWLNLLLAGYILPPFIRNALYDFIARNRYKWFGHKDECMIPTPELKARFID